MVQEYIQNCAKIASYKDIEHEIDSKWMFLTQGRFMCYEKRAEWFGTNKKKAQEDLKNFYESIKLKCS